MFIPFCLKTWFNTDNIPVCICVCVCICIINWTDKCYTQHTRIRFRWKGTSLTLERIPLLLQDRNAKNSIETKPQFNSIP